MKKEGYTESRHDQTREQRAADRAYKNPRAQEPTTRDKNNREDRFQDQLKRNGLKNEIGDLAKTGSATSKPAYLKQ